MDKLEALVNITRGFLGLLRGADLDSYQNPGKFTLQGTNTYLIGRANPYILLDAGQGIPSYTPLLDSALGAPAHPHLPDVSDIVLTHRHIDHVGGLPSVLQLLRERWAARNPDASAPYAGPRVHKFPLPADAPDEALDKLVAELPEGAFTPGPAGALHDLADGQLIAQDNPDQALTVLHTPGHTADSISLLFAADRALFTGDTVLGQGTAVFEDLAFYLASLRSMLAHSDKYAILYPAHGPVVKEGKGAIETYVAHRLQRERQVLDVLRAPPPEGGAWTVWGIVGTLYKEYPQSLWEPAAHGVGLHLRKLEGEKRARALGGEGKEGRWALSEDV